jgi:hypothetical protein
MQRERVTSGIRSLTRGGRNLRETQKPGYAKVSQPEELMSIPSAAVVIYAERIAPSNLTATC